MQDFWLSSGFKTLTKNDHGWLRVTPDYLRHLLHRPELAPIAESGRHERALHAALLDDPKRAVSIDELEAIEDPDARENVIHFLKWRKALLDAVTLERFYLNAFRQAAFNQAQGKGAIDLPPLFFDLSAEAILRGLLDGLGEGADDVYEIRAAEMFFRRQRVSIEDGQVLCADAETIQLFAETGGFGNVGRLFAQQKTPMATVNMDVLNHENSQLYWFGEDRYKWVLDLTQGRAGDQALARLLGRWVTHFFGCAVECESLTKIEDDAWRWHVGLDIESTAILNDLYEGNPVDEARMKRLTSLYRLRFRDPTDMRSDVAGKPVYLALAITEDHVLKLKPQNLILNLPLAATT
jgi:Family of unknown function (DUF6352)